MILYAGAGMLVVDQMEERFGMVPTEEERAELKRALPRVRAVD
jgi:hypothetical protein